MQAPPGGFYSSSPAPDEQLNLGEAVVNSAAAPVDNLTVSNPSVDDFTISAFNSAATELTLPAGSFTVPGEGSVTFDGANAVTCTPSTVGNNAGLFSVAHDAAGGATSAVNYGFTCTGLAPNVQVAPTSVTLNGSIGGTPPTGSFTIENPDNETASDAQNASLTVTTDAGEITITDNIDDNVISVGETDTVTFSCSTAAAGGPFTETVQVAWDDPVGGGQATQDVTVTCNIANIAPGYTSDPAANTAGTEIDFTQVPFGSSSTETIAIGNEDSVGTGAQAELEVTGATLSDTTNYSIDPASPTFTLAADAANGTETIDVTCTPSGVGAVPDATLTVESNDGDQVYDLACEGDGELLSTSPSGGLNLGVVPPGTTTNEGTISFTNNGISGDITVENCSFSGPTDVFDSTPGVADFGFELQPGQSEIRRFQCTPPDISSFALDVSCDVTGGDNATLDFTVSCAGRPLVIPTMSRWGLVVMSLMLLLVGGFATRRMMA